jgi:hypothetical protein
MTPPGATATGNAVWSHDPADAARFTPEELAALYKAVPANRPVRPDGKPNRPITMFTLMTVPVAPGEMPSILPGSAPDGPAQRAPTPPSQREPVSLADELRAMGLM